MIGYRSTMTPWKRRKLRFVMWVANLAGVPVDVRPDYFGEGANAVSLAVARQKIGLSRL